MGLAIVDREVVAESPVAAEGPASHTQQQSSYLHQPSATQGCSLAALLEQPASSNQLQLELQLQSTSSNLLADGLQSSIHVDMETDFGDDDDDHTRKGNAGQNKASGPANEACMVSDSTAGGTWDNVPGLGGVQLSALQSVATRGVVWTHPVSKVQQTFTLHHGGDVESDGNCLFTAVSRILGPSARQEARDIRQIVVKRFLKDYQSGALDKGRTDQAIKNLYSPDLKSGWGVHMVQEVKLLARKVDRGSLDTAVEDLMSCGMGREAAAEVVCKERCASIVDGSSWAQFMAVCGSEGDEHDIITLHYTEEGLLSLDENRNGRAAAFGDDIAIESIAAEYGREVFVMQAHGIDGMVDTDTCLFFLPHSPRGGAVVSDSPVFLFMKGTGWCGGGADHYEPVIAKQLDSSESDEKPVVFL